MNCMRQVWRFPSPRVGVRRDLVEYKILTLYCSYRTGRTSRASSLAVLLIDAYENVTPRGARSRG